MHIKSLHIIIIIIIIIILQFPLHHARSPTKLIIAVRLYHHNHRTTAAYQSASV